MAQVGAMTRREQQQPSRVSSPGKGQGPGQSHVDFAFRFDDCVVSAFVKGADLERRVWMKEPNDDSWTGWHHLQAF
jgi:hypothetical protein